MASPSPYPASTAMDIWRRGFRAMFRRELHTWRWRKFLTSAIAWLVVLILVALVLGGNVGVTTSRNGGAPTVRNLSQGFFFQAWLFFPMLAAIFSTLGAISDERRQGTLPWVLSKPLPRSAFYLAKLSANLLVKAMTIILMPGLLAAIILASRGVAVNPVGLFGAMKLVGVVLAFYVTLTLMMDAIGINRTATLIIPSLLLLVSPVLPQLALLFRMPVLGSVLTQVTPMGITSTVLSNWVTAGQAPDNFLPIICTVLWAVGFTLVGVTALKRQEI
ncbi:MAG: ABC transporter permease [Nodosilinea sp.]